MKKINSSSSSAFTLVELMVVIAIIAILTGVILTSLSGSRSKGRDSVRVADLSKIQIALGAYYERCHQYPLPVVNTSIISDDLLGVGNGCPGGTTLRSFINHIPTPPTGSVPANYSYQVNNGTLPTDYILAVTLENYSDVIKDALSSNLYLRQNPTPTPPPLVCSSSVGSKVYCIGPK